MAESPIYSLIREWFDFSFENQDKVRPIHCAVYLWHVELNNRMGWVENFASPATQTMAACGILNYKTYKSCFDELVSWGRIGIVKASKNQHQANIVTILALVKNTNTPTNTLTKADFSPLESALVNFTKATTKALTKADLTDSESALVKNTNTHTNTLPPHLPKHLPTHLPHNKTITIDNKTIEQLPIVAPAESLFPDLPKTEKEKKEKKVAAKKEKAAPVEETKKEICYPFNSSEFLQAWKNWKEYKAKEHKFFYKSEHSEQAALMGLSNLSNENEQTALKIIMQSMANGWKGFVPLKIENQNNNGNQQSKFINNRERNQNELEQFKDDLAAGFRRMSGEGI